MEIQVAPWTNISGTLSIWSDIAQKQKLKWKNILWIFCSLDQFLLPSLDTSMKLKCTKIYFLIELLPFKSPFRCSSISSSISILWDFLFQLKYRTLTTISRKWVEGVNVSMICSISLKLLIVKWIPSMDTRISVKLMNKCQNFLKFSLRECWKFKSNPRNLGKNWKKLTFSSKFKSNGRKFEIFLNILSGYRRVALNDTRIQMRFW